MSLQDTSRSLTSAIVNGANRKEKYPLLDGSCKQCEVQDDLEIHHEIYPTRSKEVRKAIDEGKIHYLCKPCHYKKSNENRKYVVHNISCECGYGVSGNSDKHLGANLKIHRQSNRHKKLMRGKK